MDAKSGSGKSEERSSQCGLRPCFLERFSFEKGETRGGGTAPPGPTENASGGIYGCVCLVGAAG